MKTVTLELDDTVYTLLEVLTRGESAPQDTVEGVIYELIDQAQQGVYRPAAPGSGTGSAKHSVITGLSTWNRAILTGARIHDVAAAEKVVMNPRQGDNRDMAF